MDDAGGLAVRIGMILASRFPPDIRVEKELSTLSKEHEIFLLCVKDGNSPDRGVLDGVKISRVFSDGQRWRNNWRLMLTCHSSSWEREIGRYIQNNSLEILHVHDLPLLGAALKMARKQGVLVVADLHENYPAMLVENLKVPIRNRISLGALAERFLLSVERWAKYERSAVAKADAVITVIEEARDRLVQEGVPSVKVHVVANYNFQAEAVDASEKEQRVNPAPERLQVIYAGGFDGARDLHTVIDALAFLKESEIPELKIVMVGGSGRALEELRRYAVKKHVTGKVSIREWVSRNDVERLMDGAQIGLVPHVKSAHTDSTIPHKLFQYMARRLPVIVSDCIPLERIVLESQCGLVYRSRDSRSFADCLRHICNDPWEIKRMGDAGYAAVMEKYNWEKAGEVLLGMYRQLARIARTAPAGNFIFCSENER